MAHSSYDPLQSYTAHDKAITNFLPICRPMSQQLLPDVGWTAWCNPGTFVYTQYRRASSNVTWLSGSFCQDAVVFEAYGRIVPDNFYFTVHGDANDASHPDRFTGASHQIDRPLASCLLRAASDCEEEMQEWESMLRYLQGLCHSVHADPSTLVRHDPSQGPDSLPAFLQVCWAPQPATGTTEWDMTRLPIFDEQHRHAPFTNPTDVPFGHRVRIRFTLWKGAFDDGLGERPYTYQAARTRAGGKVCLRCTASPLFLSSHRLVISSSHPPTMSLFEPFIVRSQIKATIPAKDQVAWEDGWKRRVAARLDTWGEGQKKREKRAKGSKDPKDPKETEEEEEEPKRLTQPEWEVNVLEYVSFLWEKTWVHGNARKGTEPASLAKNVPLLGPRFLPPTHFHLQRREKKPDIHPALLYLKPLNVIHPFYYPELGACPQCSAGADETLWDSWTMTGHRQVHGLWRKECAVGYQLHCKRCESVYGPTGIEKGRHHYCFATTMPAFWKKHEVWDLPRRSSVALSVDTKPEVYSGDIPVFLHRCALTRELFDLIVELRPQSTSGGLAESVKQLHLLEYQQCQLEYLRRYGSQRKVIFSKSRLEPFSPPGAVDGFTDKSITDDLITHVYLEYIDRTRKEEAALIMKTLAGDCLVMDHTFRAADKATVVSHDGTRTKLMKGGLLSVINESSQILSWRLCQSGAHAEIVELLRGLRRRYDALGHGYPDMITVDNCCTVRNTIHKVFPTTNVVLDIHHFLARYLVTTLGGTKNQHRAAVARDIVDAMLISRTSKNEPAKYWSKEEQESRLQTMFEKWSAIGGVWSAASSDAHAVQLQHVKLRCLACSRQDVRSDGSRIESTHEHWNSIQRSYACGVALLDGIGNDKCLPRDLQIAGTFSDADADPFIALTHGSHHVKLAQQISATWNMLLTKEKTPRVGDALEPRAELRVIKSNETFGLVCSEYATTFGGLLEMKSEDFNDDDIITSITNRELESDRIMQAMNIKPELASIPQRDVHSTHNPRGGLVPPAPFAHVEAQSVVIDLTDEAADAARGSTIDLMSDGDGGTSHELEVNAGTRLAKRKHAETAVLLPPTEEGPACKRQAIGAAPWTPAAGDADNGPSELPEAGLTPAPHEMHLPRSAQAINTFFPPQPKCAAAATRGTSSSIPAALTTPVPAPVPLKGLSRSEALFALTTGIHPHALRISSNDEFFLFMDMRDEHQWASFSMNSQLWVAATEEYNMRLLAKDPKAIPKNPRALFEKLGQVEPIILKRVATGNYASKKGSEMFWRRHCSAVSLIKPEPAPDAKPRKPQTCSRCCMVKYPYEKGSPLNHKKHCCADGVKSTLQGGSRKGEGKKAPKQAAPLIPTGSGPQEPAQPHATPSKVPPKEILPSYPQPCGIFSNGSHFHPLAFLKAVHDMYMKVIVGDIPASGLDMEEQEFASMFANCSVHVDGYVLFRLFDYLTESPQITDHVVMHEGARHLRIDLLKDMAATALQGSAPEA
ncbi:hypothetical protein EVG20_g10326 [Dentipellis fragilis]|uniref:Uncharacterized protein n=1 Tax=Dentipellis fragilis TaxID=205917 RepID=A0A4Y9XRL9_9AGAM|nr:hypothetical protein EVG20_g10326 [Dentipellis fragilis]